MGYRFNKSLKVGGGFRVNLSKSGVGYSWGIPGYRITKTATGKKKSTVSIPGTGLQKSSTIGSKRKTNEPISNKTSSPIPENDEELHEISSANISEFQSSEYEDIIRSFKRSLRIDFIANILILCLLLVVFNLLFLILPILGIVLKILLYTVLKVDMQYNYDDEKTKENFEKKVSSWKTLNESDMIWQSTHEKSISNIKENAGANTIIKRKSFKLLESKYYFFSTNVNYVVLTLNRENLIILPDKIIIINGIKVGAIDNKKLDVEVSDTKFIETDHLANDAKIIDYTWQYVNKNGTPDKRFKNNVELPVCIYGLVEISSPEGLNIELMTSNSEVAQKFGSKLKEAVNL